jgi:hypothetical protein
VLIGMMDSGVVLIDMLGKAFSYFEDRGGQKKTANEVAVSDSVACDARYRLSAARGLGKYQ